MTSYLIRHCAIAFAFGLGVSAATEFPVYRQGAGASRPPLEVSYTLPSAVEGAAGGELDSLAFDAVYLAGIERGDVEWLLGVNTRGFLFGTSGNIVLPERLVSGALVLGAIWQMDDHWRVRVEALPGFYGDFETVDAGNFNVPLVGEVTYRINPRLEFGVQLNVDLLREMPLVGLPGVRWRFADQWVLSLWIPRPQVEFHPNETLTLFGGANLTGGSYIVSDGFGSAFGLPELNGTRVDYREIRAGVGARYIYGGRWAGELAGGWTLNRQARFHQQDFSVRSDGAPYFQVSAGLLW